MADHWNEFADSYEKTFALTSRSFCFDLISSMKIRPGDQILDIGCGTGSFERAIAEVVETGSITCRFHILAIDYSDVMIGKLRNTLLPRLSNLGLIPCCFEVETQLVDGQTLQGIADNSFNIAASSFGVVLFADRETSFLNIFRVLTAGGQFVFNVWPRRWALAS